MINTHFSSDPNSEDKRRRRRESHNAGKHIFLFHTGLVLTFLVERRRRENINEKIQELGALLPDNLIDNNRTNKGQILTNTVQYIRFLQDIIRKHIPSCQNNPQIFPSNPSYGGLSNEAANFSAMAMALPNPSSNTNPHS